MLRTRRLICLLALILALPSAAFAQGAGDDQYQDPFGDEPAAQQGGGNGDGGIGDQPPGDDDGGSGSNGGSGDSGSGSGGDTGTGGGGETDTGTGGDDTATTPADRNALPNTGADPRPLVLIGAAFLLGGIGLRLRTIDPDAY